jgi:hypothetical protein
MNTLQILDRVGREINQSVFDNTKTVTRDDVLSAISDCNDEMSDLNLPFNEAGPTTYTWAAADLEVDIVSDVGITDYDRVKRLEIDNIKAFPVSFNELDAKVRGSFDSTQDLSLQPHPPVYTEWGGKFYRWPYSAAGTLKLWYYKQLASLTADVDQSNYTAATNTYTVPTSISEGATALQTFIPTQANQGGIVIYIDTDGGEPITVTVHNSSNVSQGSKTIHQPGTGRIMFPIAWTWASGTYHFHVTTTAGTTYLKAGTASDLETCYFESWYGSTPAIPSRYHMLYVYFATATALRKLGEINKAEIYDDGKPVETGGRSKYRMLKSRMIQKMSQKLTSDRPRFIEDLLDSDNGEDY